MELFLNALLSMFTLSSLGIMIMGVGVGIIFGSIPGLSAAMAIALFLPITFAMGPEAGHDLAGITLYRCDFRWFDFSHSD